MALLRPLRHRGGRHRPLVERLIIAPVRRRTKSPVRLLILTIGVSQVLLALTYIPGLIPTSTAPFPQPFNSNVQLGGVVLSGMDLLTLIAVPAILVLLTIYLEFTSIGKQIRAAAGNPDAHASAESRCPTSV